MCVCLFFSSIFFVYSTLCLLCFYLPKTSDNILICSVLQDDEWFADVAQIAIKMLTGKANFADVEHDGSPTASVSARSASSVHSHGSS